MRSLLVFSFLFFSVLLFAQEDSVITRRPTNKDSIRSLYIQTFPNHFFIYPVLKQRTLYFQLERNDRSALLTYKPNNSYSFGVGTYLFELGFELAFAIPINEKSKEIYGESKARDLQLNVLGKKWGLDAFYQKYSGFYVSDRDNKPDAGIPYPQRPDIDSRNFGLTGNYVLNNQKFSFRSAYNFAERQIYSKGSFLLFTTLGSFKISSDSSILSNQQKTLFGQDVSFTRLRYATFSIAPGYTYNLIYKNFFLNGTLSVGPAHHWTYYRLEGGEGRNEIGINTFVAARIGIGYNGEKLFGGISFSTQGSDVKFQDAKISNNNSAFKILVGYRFREFGVLRKRYWELIPFKI